MLQKFVSKVKKILRKKKKKNMQSKICKKNKKIKNKICNLTALKIAY